jgi:NitT/TauT family transport system permease protein
VSAVAEPRPGRRGAGIRRAGRGLREWLPAVAVFVIGIALWEGLVRALHVQQFLLPAPSAIADTFWSSRSTLMGAGWFTFKEALGGFLVGSGAAILFAVVVSRFRSLGSALMPVAIAANAIPIIAFAPITNAWFSPFSPSAKIAIAAVLCFFPVMINTLRGLTSVRPEQIELMRSYAAGELTVYRRVRFPTALPYIFTALKIASVLAMIGAIVGEYFGGSLNALGVLIRSRAQLLDFKQSWAGIVVACIFGIGFYLAVAAAERLALRWVPPERETRS